MRAHARFLHIAAFGSGFAVMGAEVACGRLLAPYFGTSTPVWSALIGTVLGSLAIGALLGGQVSQRNNAAARVFIAMQIAGGMLVLLPAITRPLMRSTMTWFMSSAMLPLAFAGFLVFVAISLPVILLGMLSPVLVRYAASEVGEVGKAAGKVSAFGTFGSLIGTFFCGIFLVPTFGTEAAFRVCGGIALVLGVAGWLRFRVPTQATDTPTKRDTPQSLLIALPLLFGTWALPHSRIGEATALLERETPYNYLRITETEDRRVLYLNEGFAMQTVKLRSGRPYLRGVWAYYASALGLSTQRPSRILIIGLGGGASASYFAARLPDAQVVAVELDPGVVDVARNYFDLPARVEVHVADARTHLAQDRSLYDLVVVDAFQFPYIPFQLTTHEFFRDLKQHLKPGAAVMMNVGRKNQEHGVVHAVATTLAASFPQVYGVDVRETTNTMLVASVHPLAQSIGLAALGLPEDEVRQLSELDPLHPWEAPSTQAMVLTDDRAPLEWLTNQIIARELGRMLQTRRQ
jgi:spermidine synthase